MPPAPFVITLAAVLTCRLASSGEVRVPVKAFLAPTVGDGINLAGIEIYAMPLEELRPQVHKRREEMKKLCQKLQGRLEELNNKFSEAKNELADARDRAEAERDAARHEQADYESPLDRQLRLRSVRRKSETDEAAASNSPKERLRSYGDEIREVQSELSRMESGSDFKYMPLDSSLLLQKTDEKGEAVLTLDDTKKWFIWARRTVGVRPYEWVLEVSDDNRRTDPKKRLVLQADNTMAIRRMPPELQ